MSRMIEVRSQDRASRHNPVMQPILKPQHKLDMPGSSESRSEFSFWQQQLRIVPLIETLKVGRKPRDRWCDSRVSLMLMDQRDTLRIDQAMENVLKVLDSIQAHQFDEKLYCKYFKDLRYKNEVYSVLSNMQQYARQYLQRGQAIPGQDKFLSRFIAALPPEPNGEAGDTTERLPCISRGPRQKYLGDDVLNTDVILYPSFFDDTKYCLLDRVSNSPLLESKRDQAVRIAREATLMHEIAHLVTSGKGQFDSMTQRTGTAHFIKDPWFCIPDVCLPDWAHPESQNDQILVALSTQGLERWQNGEAYGVQNTELLAQLEQGAEASLMNAESYMVFAMDHYFKYSDN